VAEHYEHTPVPADAEFVTAMANLATATSADRETVATLTQAIMNLTDQLKAKDIWAKLLNSRSPNCARAHTHRQVRAL
jgi:TRAP-type uncharacterized transport system substrate-binding protein